MKIDAYQALAAYRVRKGQLASTDEIGNNGAFMVPYIGGTKDKPKTVTLGVIMSDGEGWDHVSVSLPTRCPTWEEMCFIKDLCFEPTEAVMQLHPPKAEHINYHPYCLHLWRPHNRSIPMPPAYMVGPKPQPCTSH